MGEFYSKKSCFVSFFLICIYLALSTSLVLAKTAKPSRTKLPKQFSQPLAKPSQTQQIKTLNPNNLEKEAYRIWLDWHQAQKQGKNLAIPQFSVLTSLDKEEANRVLTIWEQAQTKAYWTVEEEEMYKVWLEYCRDQQQGITTEMPTLTHPSDARLEQQKLAITHWRRAESRAKRTVEKEAINRPKPTDQMQAEQASNITESNSLPNVVIDDETRHKAARSISPLLDVPTSQPTSGFNQVAFNQSRGISDVSAYSRNSPQPSHLQTNSPEAVMINNNQLLAEMNTETTKAKKLVNIETAKHLVDRHDSQQPQTNLNPSTSSGSQLVRRFVYGSQGPISMSQLINGQWVTSYFIYDGDGNVRALTDPNGNVTDTFDYDAFGNLINRTGNTPNNHLYHAEEFDSDLGMYYFRARFLNTATGRFFTQDSFEGSNFVPASLHKYTYTHNNPINNTDPTGNSITSIAAASIDALTLFTIPTAQVNSLFNQGGATPSFLGTDLKSVDQGLREARERTANNPQCDTALFSPRYLGLSPNVYSLNPLVSKLNFTNVFDGRNSTYTPLVPGNPQKLSIKELFKQNKGVAAVTTLYNNQPTVFLNQPFFSFSDFPQFARATILLHESVHPFANLEDLDYGNTVKDGSFFLNTTIASGCYSNLFENPVFRERLFGNLTSLDLNKR